jgi:hypothetical protein
MTEPTISQEPPEPEAASSAAPTPGEPAAAPPAASAPPPAVAALQSSWQGFGQAERLAVGGGALVFIAFLLGVITSGWSVGLYGLSLLGASAVLVVAVFARATMPGSILGHAAIIRGAAAILGGFAVADTGDLLGNLGDWGTIDIVLTIVYIVGAAAALWGAVAVTGGNLVSDAQGLVSMSRSLPERLVVYGALLVPLAWFLMLLSDNVGMGTDADLALIVVMLAVVLVWATSSGAIRTWPIPASYLIGGTAGLGALLAIVWVLQRISGIGDEGILAISGLVVYLVAGIALAAGAALVLRDVLASQRGEPGRSG